MKYKVVINSYGAITVAQVLYAEAGCRNGLHWADTDCPDNPKGLLSRQAIYWCSPGPGRQVYFLSNIMLAAILFIALLLGMYWAVHWLHGTATKY
jgi:hypothetical protein